MYSNIKERHPFATSILFFMLLSVIVLLNSSCKKFVEIEAPTTSITGKNVFSTDPTAIAVLTGVYSNMSGTIGITSGELTSIGFLTGLSSDELTLYGGIQDGRSRYYRNELNAKSDSYSFWNIIYPKIYIFNSAIEGITKSQTLNVKVKQQLLGEAKFMRAFCYFYLVNLYGDVPLVTSSDYSVNMVLPRLPKDKIWEQIVMDLKDAQILLSDDYLDITLLKATSERVRPNKWAATALLARAYLFTKEWKNAEIESSMVIGHSTLYHLENLNDVFKRTSMEAIWQLQPVNFRFNTEDARSYIITDFGPSENGGVYVSDQLLQSFEQNDQRKTSWIGVKTYKGTNYHFAYKYKLTEADSPEEYHTIFRLAELYLIKAESLAEQGNYIGAIANIDAIRSRANLPLIKDINPKIGIADLRSMILKERQHEFFTEWGHRWLDLKRTNSIDAVMEKATPLKGGYWNSNWQLYPIPSNEIVNDRNLIQNPGY